MIPCQKCCFPLIWVWSRQLDNFPNLLHCYYFAPSLISFHFTHVNLPQQCVIRFLAFLSLIRCFVLSVYSLFIPFLFPPYDCPSFNLALLEVSFCWMGIFPLHHHKALVHRAWLDFPGFFKNTVISLLCNVPWGNCCCDLHNINKPKLKWTEKLLIQLLIFCQRRQKTLCFQQKIWKDLPWKFCSSFQARGSIKIQCQSSFRLSFTRWKCSNVSVPCFH